jgi:hypothetical protein
VLDAVTVCTRQPGTRWQGLCTSINLSSLPIDRQSSNSVLLFLAQFDNYSIVTIQIDFDAHIFTPDPAIYAHDDAKKVVLNEATLVA